MRLPALLLSDLHLTANPADEYRWSIFKWVLETIALEDIQTVCILGDLTDAKDYHPAALTNRLVQSLVSISWLGVRVIVLQGNHDYLKRGEAYFRFLSELPNITYVAEPWTDDSEGPLCIFLPHTKTPAKDWEGWDFSHFDYAFMHQTVGGAVASNGQRMEDEGVPVPKGPKVFSGDIHVPQAVRGVEYVGSPYHVHFGDRFKPRCVLIDRRNRLDDLHFRTISRFATTISKTSELKALALKPGDQVKITVQLPEADVGAWAGVRREVIEAVAATGAELHGLKLAISRQDRRSAARQGDRSAPRVLSDPDAILQFVEKYELGPDALELGLELLR